jgi:hypothetical protein
LASAPESQRRLLGFRGGDDQLAASLVRQTALLQVAIEQLTARDTDAGLQGAGRIIDPGMDDLGIARRGLGADALGSLGDDDLASGQRQLAGNREADDAGPDHQTIDVAHRLSRQPRCGMAISMRLAQ